jgi:hypothetical protein
MQRSARTTISLFAIIISLIVARAPVAAASGSSAPLFDFETESARATVNFETSGVLPADLPPVVRLIVDRTELDPGEQLQHLDETQILVNESGSLQLTDGLGLMANFEEDEEIYAPPGSFTNLTATTSSSILRAHIDASAEDNGMVMITEDACGPSTLQLSPGQPLTVFNRTNRVQPFTIRAFNIREQLDPGAWITIPAATLGSGTWIISCGVHTDDYNPINLVTLLVRDPQVASTIAQTATTSQTSTLFDRRIEFASSEGSSFFLVRIDLAAGGSIGNQHFTGPTVLIAGDQPLMILQGNHALTQLAAFEQILWPTGTQSVVSNQGDGPTTLLLAGIAPPQPIANITSASASNAEANAAPPALLPREAAGEAAPESISSYFPADADLFGAGFLMMSTEEMGSFNDSIFNGVNDLPVIQSWLSGIVKIYAPIDSPAPGVFGVISVDRFDNSDAAHAALQLVFAPALASYDSTEPLDPPNSASADEIIAFTGTYTTSDTSATIIMARFGADIVSVVVGAPAGAASTDKAFTLWTVIETARNV